MPGAGHSYNIPLSHSKLGSRVLFFHLECFIIQNSLQSYINMFNVSFLVPEVKIEKVTIELITNYWGDDTF